MYLLIILVSYITAWTAAYAVVMGMDFRYFFDYLELAWTGRAGEVPSFIHAVALGSVVLAALISGVVFFVRRSH